MSENQLKAEFDHWWARYHPWDWYAGEDGNPLRSVDRLRMWSMCRDAFLRKPRPMGQSGMSYL
jgi:hypothetical protein